MAGIGFELKRLFRRKGLFATMRAYGYAGIVCTGPMLLGVLLLYTSGKYMSDFANSANTFVDWDNQMDHARDTDMLYLILSLIHI